MLNETALYHQARAAWAEAEPLYQRAIAIGEKTLGPDHPDLATWLNNLANLYQATGRYAEAEPLYQRAIAIGEKTLGPDHPNLAIRLNNLAVLYRATGRYAEAEPLFQRAIAIGEKTLGPDHPDLATRLNNLANLYRATGRYAEAEPLFQRAIAIGEKTLGPDHPNVATGSTTSPVSTGHRPLRRGRAPLPARHRHRREDPRPRPPRPRHWLNNLASLYRDTGRYAEAEPLFQRAIAIFEASLPPDHPNLATVRANHAATAGPPGPGRRRAAAARLRQCPGASLCRVGALSKPPQACAGSGHGCRAASPDPGAAIRLAIPLATSRRPCAPSTA